LVATAMARDIRLVKRQIFGNLISDITNPISGIMSKKTFTYYCLSFKFRF
jgi:hypothetical protein